MKDSVKEEDAINEVSHAADEYSEFEYYDEEDYGEEQKQSKQELEVEDEVMKGQQEDNGVNDYEMIREEEVEEIVNEQDDKADDEVVINVESRKANDVMIKEDEDHHRQQPIVQ